MYRRRRTSNLRHWRNSTRIPLRRLHTDHPHPTSNLFRTADTWPRIISNSLTSLCPPSRRFFQPVNLCSPMINSGTRRVRAICSAQSSVPPVSLVCFARPDTLSAKSRACLYFSLAPCSRRVRPHMIASLHPHRSVSHRSAVISWTARTSPASRSRPFILAFVPSCAFRTLVR